MDPLIPQPGPAGRKIDQVPPREWCIINYPLYIYIYPFVLTELPRRPQLVACYKKIG